MGQKILKMTEAGEIEFPKWEKTDKSGMVVSNFVQVENDILRILAIEGGAQVALTYIMLLSHRNKKLDNCFPTLGVIAKELGVTVRTVSRSLETLTELGAIKINSGGRNTASEYYFPLEEFYEEFNEEDTPIKRQGQFEKENTKINELTENERSTFKKQEKVSETKFIKAAAKATTPAIESKTTAPAPVVTARVNPEDACDAFDTTDAITADTITASQIAGDDVDF